MLTATSGLAAIRDVYEGESRDLLRVLMNATSVAEANLALEVLKATAPEKTLVSACNLREVLRALPSSPFAMRVDEDTLARTAGLDRRVAAMGKVLRPGLELVVTTAGNLVLDIIVRLDDRKMFWNPVPVTDDYVNTEVLDLLIDDDQLLDGVLDLISCMGVVCNPKFYLSLEDWGLEYAHDAFEGLGDLF
ncbi:MAG: hypothetical protein FDZ75_07530 [Actinobacteria bacterium]|nr:MAG: hypothetical protein FDZ75_07530 [Actinomycetota bacterium]